MIDHNLDPDVLFPALVKQARADQATNPDPRAGYYSFLCGLLQARYTQIWHRLQRATDETASLQRALMEARAELDERDERIEQLLRDPGRPQSAGRPTI